jgi:hypothetical protein
VSPCAWQRDLARRLTEVLSSQSDAGQWRAKVALDVMDERLQGET